VDAVLQLDVVDEVEGPIHVDGQACFGQRQSFVRAPGSARGKPECPRSTAVSATIANIAMIGDLIDRARG
jgi:hypothetical protein